MKTILRSAVLISTFALMLGCTKKPEDSTAQLEACTSEWYSLVEKQIPTGDGHGHGPDLGSDEWRSVVEFKLGIRGNAEIPSTSTQQWCTYMDKHYIQ